MKNLKKCLLATSLVIVAIPAAYAAPKIIRTILSCIDDSPLVNYEIGARFSPSGLLAKNGAGAARGVGDRGPYNASSGLGTISEEPDSVTIAFANSKVRLSDGKYRDVSSSYTMSRLTYSYGAGSQAALNPGWAYI